MTKPTPYGLAALLALLSILTTASGCSVTPEPVYVTRTVEIYRDRYIPLDSWLTAPVEVPALSSDFDVYELGAVAKQRETRLLQCNSQLAEIGSIQP